ncbi:MAG: hypothetical protein IT497_04735 [Ottowia sp.]|nr:hypothetical protein [Ottowia sp.]
MKTCIHIIIATFLLCTTIAQAATCRSGNAAARGSQQGYERDKQAAEQVAKTEQSSSDILGKCVGGITGVLTAPQFPSLSDIFNQVQNKVCQIARNQIDGVINDANGRINNTMNGIHNQVNKINQSTAGEVVPSPQITNPAVQRNGGNSASQFWSDIWK